MKILAFIIFVNFILIPQSIGIADVQKKFNSIEDFSAEFKQSVDGKIGLSGKIFFKKKNNFRAELKNLIIITDGISSWNYQQRDNKVIISDYSEEDQSLFSIEKLILEYPSKCKIEESSEGGRSLILLTPQNSSLNFKRAKLWVDENSLITKMIITDLNNSQILVEFNNYKLNQKIPQSKFNFTPPEGCKVIDLR